MNGRCAANDRRYREEVEKLKPLFKEIVGSKILKITIPKDSLGNPEDAFIFHIHDNHKTRLLKIESSEWIHMGFEEE